MKQEFVGNSVGGTGNNNNSSHQLDDEAEAADLLFSAESFEDMKQNMGDSDGEEDS